MEITINLDDENKTTEIDQSGMLETVKNFPQQCRDAVEIANNVSLEKGYAEVNSILILGMGGSGIGGDVLKALLKQELTIPVWVNKGYDIPHFVDETTLVFAVSCSGNTEETLSGFDQSLEKGAKIVVISSGGAIKERADKHNIPVIKIPAGYQPRAAIGYLFFPMLAVLQKLELISNKSDVIEETMGVLDGLSERFSSDKCLAQNQAKQIAQILFGRIPVIYGSNELIGVAALRWKCQLNENSKIPAFWHYLPELNHNEIVGWKLLDNISTESFIVFILRDEGDSVQLRKRAEITKELIEDQVSEVYEVWTAGDSELAKVFSMIYLGDFVSAYLAILNEVDPTPVKRIDILKERLKEKEGCEHAGPQSKD